MKLKLELKDIYKSFSGTQVLHGVSFTINRGKALGFLGRNGSGKTTTMRILMNLFNADSGEILLNGQSFKVNKHSVGYLPEERGLYPKQKVLKQLIYFGELRGLDRNEAKKNSLYWLEKLGVDKYKDKNLDTLSKGNQQKVQIAETLVCNPDLVVLDEPFSGLDPVNSQVLKDIISELISAEKFVIFSSHQMSYVEEFCEEIVLIDQGKVALTGNLDSIKKEYGMNKITLSSVDLDPKALADLVCKNTSNIDILEVKSKYIVIELLENKTKQDLLADLIDLNVDINKFSVYEPSLNEIFVETVGDKNEKLV